MNGTPQFSGFLLRSLISFSHGNARNSDGGGMTVSPGAQPIAATHVTQSKGGKWREEHMEEVVVGQA